MGVSRAILCPVDFSPASLSALRHAIVLANYAEAALTVTTVDDGLLAEVGDARMGAGWARANSERELRSFFASAGGLSGSGVTFERPLNGRDEGRDRLDLHDGEVFAPPCVLERRGRSGNRRKRGAAP